MPPPHRLARKAEIALRLAICGVCGTLILSQFPAPLSHVFIAVANYCLLVVGQEDAMEARYVNIGWLFNKAATLQRRYQENAVVAGLLTGGPGGWLWSSILSGALGYYTPEVIAWGA
jgi:hypothetical protein